MLSQFLDITLILFNDLIFPRGLCIGEAIGPFRSESLKNSATSCFSYQNYLGIPIANECKFFDLAKTKILEEFQ